MNTIEQRVKDALMWCDDPGITNAILALAREVSRPEEIVYLEDQIDANVQSRDVPDDGLYRRLETLRRECGEGEAGSEGGYFGVGPAQERMQKTVARRRAALDTEPPCCWSGELEPFFSTVEEMAAVLTREQLAYILGTRVNFVPRERLDAVSADYRRAVAEGAAMAEKLSQSEDRLMDARKQVKEMEADAALGRAIRELRPKEGHLWVEARIRAGFDTPFVCRVSWRSETRDGVRNTFFHASLADAIAEYNERKD